MAQKDLKQILKKLEADLERNSAAYRDLVSDKKVHSISLDRQELRTQVKEELTLRRGGFSKLPASIETIVDEECDRMFEYLKQRLKPENFNASTRKIFFTEEFKETPNSFIVLLAVKKDKGSRNVFGHFRRIKQIAQKNLVKKLNIQIKKLNSNRSNKIEEINSSEFLNVGHFEENAVSMQRKRAVENALFNFGQKGSKEVAPFISDLRDSLKLKIKKHPGDPIDIIGVGLESSFLNKKRGREVEAKLAPQLNQALARVMENLDAAGLKGSMSAEERRIQMVENELANIASSTKKITTNIRKKKISKKKTKTENSNKTKVARAKSFKDNTKAPKVVFDTKQSRAGSTISLLALLNSQLTKTVSANMGSPRLENRTGRFASSVRAVDVQKTKQGFLSIGYTYEKDPYQVFEKSSGSRFSSLERDPRSLIDTSIREIAAQMVTTKLYTRRV
jgi:hypothetical protein